MTKVFRIVIIAIVFLFYAYAAHETDSPTQQLANVVRFFNTTELCNRNCDADTWYDDYGSLNIRFRTAIKEGDDTDKLCKCMYNYINQNDWLVDADHQCIDDCENLSLILIGPPNPDYNPNTSAPSKPVASLAAVLKQFSNASLGMHTCNSTNNVQSDGLTRIVLKCKLTCQAPRPTPKQAREDIMKYLNQNHWLDDAKTTCKSRGRCLRMEIIGK